MSDVLERLKEPHDEARARANWQRIQERRSPRGRSRAPKVIGGAVLLAAAAALLLWAWPRPGSLTTGDGRTLAGPLTTDRVELDDGSIITLDDATALEVLENDGERMRLWMREGAASFDVTPGGPRRWTIETGQVSVEVLGTSFRVERLGDDVRVSVTRGVVLVRGPTTPDGLARLTAGDTLTVASEVRPAEAAAAATIAPSPIEPSVEPAVETAPVEPVAPEPRRAPSVAPRDEAEVEAEVEAEPSAPARTLAEADALRRAGRLSEARAVLQAIADDPGAGHDAALAAFTLGRIEHDLHEPAAAAESFRRAIALGLPATLVEDARARRVRALAAAGDAAALEEAGRDYLEHHPDGRRRGEVERWLER